MNYERDKSKPLKDRVDKLENQVDYKYFPMVDKHNEILDKGKGGIDLASALDSRLTTVFVAVVFGAIAYFLFNGGNW